MDTERADPKAGPTAADDHHSGPPVAIVVRRSLESCGCHPGPTYVVACPRCDADAYAWRYGRPGQERSSGWSCISCGRSGGLWKLEEAV